MKHYDLCFVCFSSFVYIFSCDFCSYRSPFEVQKLLANAPAAASSDPRNVIVEKLIFKPDDHAEIALDLTGLVLFHLSFSSRHPFFIGDLSRLKDSPVIIKEGCTYQLLIQFRFAEAVSIKNLSYFLSLPHAFCFEIAV